MASNAAVQDRAKAAVLGALVADAATMGLHWIYDQGKIQALLEDAGKVSEPEFFDPPSCPFYQYPSGAFSPYGDELLPVLQYLAQHGSLDGRGFAQFLGAYYKAYAGRLNHSSKTVVANVDAGRQWPETGDAEDKQGNAFVKVPPIVARYAGQPELLAAVDAAVRAQQNNDAAVGYAKAAALVLERVVLGATVEQAVDWALAGGLEGEAPGVAAELQSATARLAESLQDAIKALGLSCAMPGSLQGGVLAALQAKGKASYVEGVRANIGAAGDQCSRAVLLGALLAAQDGMDAIPATWREKTKRYAEVEANLTQLLAHRA